MRYIALALPLVLACSIGARGNELAFDLNLARGHLPEDMRLIRIHQGDAVKLRWTSDRPLTLHVHGYNIEKRVMPGVPTEMNFTAYATGRFPVHVHGTAGSGGGGHEEAPLAVIEVYPR